MSGAVSPAWPSADKEDTRTGRLVPACLVSPGAVTRRPLPSPGWAGARDVLLVVLATALQVTGPRAGDPGHWPDLLAGLAGATVGRPARTGLVVTAGGGSP